VSRGAVVDSAERHADANKIVEVVMVRTRRLAMQLGATLVLYLSLGLNGSTAVAAWGSRTDMCEEVCTLDAPCETECGVAAPDLPIFETDCGAYTDGQCGNECDMVCTPEDDGTTECSGSGGDPTTCEDYGVYRHCGDYYCAKPFESFGNCPADCPSTTPTSLPPPFDPSDPEELCDAAAYGGSSLPCPIEYPPNTPSCIDKLLKLDDLYDRLRVIDQEIGWYEDAKSGCTCSDYDSQLAALYAESLSKYGDLFTVLASQCYPGPAGRPSIAPRMR